MFPERLVFKEYTQQTLDLAYDGECFFLLFPKLPKFLSLAFEYFFYRSLSPNVEVGALWPPTGVEGSSPLQVPLLNASILLSSGFTVT